MLPISNKVLTTILKKSTGTQMPKYQIIEKQIAKKLH